MGHRHRGLERRIGIVIPPSITMVVYGAIADTSIGDLFVGGFIPGIRWGEP